MARSSYESRLAKAAEEDDFKAFQAAYRERDKWRDGRGTINGDLARDVVGTPEQVAASNPIRVAPGARAVVAPDTLAVRASMDSNFQNLAQQREAAEEASRMRYKSFLSDQGVDPYSLSGMPYVTNTEGERVVRLPTRDEEEGTLKAEAELSKLRSRATRLARSSQLRRDYGGQYQFGQMADALSPETQNPVVNRNLMIQRFLQGTPTQRRYGTGNGYAQ